ncbi:hypothetical protein UL82_07275 [Corynebacterium kutscheri]|uniref:Uncharacterized protein n=1 Tax=Corynebacterium kutscheri TaxID=35755 RepID=A0A0F6R0A6_9CORY|nr:hypothetical protein [Corynebacterium kutscheri]AKE41617.1 hypothetical protein UL82_07275 [Corynebacterium kutscheri]VEH09943.1 Uncharacterised protein [Corynebacterium kutscheri]
MVVLSTTYFLAREESINDAYEIYKSRITRANQEEFISILFFSQEVSPSEEGTILEILLDQFKEENKGENIEGLLLFRVDCIANLMQINKEFHIDTPDLEKLASYLFMDEEYSVKDKYPSFVFSQKLRTLEHVD